jgi:plasmid stabilization system protein ParE
VRIVFTAEYKQDLREARRYYAGISQARADDLRDQVKEVIRTIVERNGGDHVGPHGRSPYPYLVYYRIVGEMLYILGLVHERRHPEHLRRGLRE